MQRQSRYRVTHPFEAEMSAGVVTAMPGQVVALSHRDAVPLIEAGVVIPLEAYTDEERRMLTGVSEELRSFVHQVKDVLGGVVVSVDRPFDVTRCSEHLPPGGTCRSYDMKVHPKAPGLHGWCRRGRTWCRDEEGL